MVPAAVTLPEEAVTLNLLVAIVKSLATDIVLDAVTAPEIDIVPAAVTLPEEAVTLNLSVAIAKSLAIVMVPATLTLPDEEETMNLFELIVKSPFVAIAPVAAVTTNLSVFIFKSFIAEIVPSFPNVTFGLAVVPPINTLPVEVIDPASVSPVRAVTKYLLPIAKLPSAVILLAVVTTPASETVNLFVFTLMDVEFKELAVVILPVTFIKPLD